MRTVTSPSPSQVECAACHKMFFRPKSDSCFLTCSKCRRKDKKKHKTPKMRSYSRSGGWDEGDNSWDNTISTIEGG
jgi:hypothetical protein